jgi:outer membrane protein OmpA-like peptidoglycan-associated protein
MSPWTLWAAAALAQDVQDSGYNFELFHPAGDLYGYTTVHGAATLQNLQLGSSFWVSYEDDPIVLVDENGERISVDGSESDGLVDSRLGGDFQIGMGFTRFASVVADIPLVMSQDAWQMSRLDNPSLAPVRGTSGGVSDIRIEPKVAVLDRDFFPVGLGLVVPVSVPSGADADFMGDGAVTVAPTVIAEFSNGSIHNRAYTWRLAVNTGYLLRNPARVRDTNMASAVLYGLGTGFRVATPVELTAEFHGQSAGTKSGQNPAEAILGVKGLVGRWVALNAGGGLGVLGGIGAPDFRIVAGATVAPSFDPAARDTDHDGVPDGMDKCPKDAEDKDGFQDEDGCPELDNDADGREDSVDKCPNDPEDDDGYLDNDGCPEPDNDRDGVLDGQDRCPNDAGPADREGCPNLDTDGDGIPNDLDRCPYDAEDMDGDRDEDGCPDEQQRVVVEKNFIRINDLIYFDFNKVTIQERSYDLLNEIAKVINDNAQLLRIRIEGHTDNVGSDLANLKLSQGRAESVKAYLVSRGVDARRLDAAGFGEMRPVATNDTEDGRAQNRRVEFIIVDQK